jgi:hypothetical protein
VDIQLLPFLSPFHGLESHSTNPQAYARGLHASAAFAAFQTIFEVLKLFTCYIGHALKKKIPWKT